MQSLYPLFYNLCVPRLRPVYKYILFSYPGMLLQ